MTGFRCFSNCNSNKRSNGPYPNKTLVTFSLKSITQDPFQFMHSQTLQRLLKSNSSLIGNRETKRTDLAFQPHSHREIRVYKDIVFLISETTGRKFSWGQKSTVFLLGKHRNTGAGRGQVSGITLCFIACICADFSFLNNNLLLREAVQEEEDLGGGHSCAADHPRSGIVKWGLEQDGL